MKKYYCYNCKEFKSRRQLKRVDDGRLSHLICRYCHRRSIYKTDDLIINLIDIHTKKSKLL